MSERNLKHRLKVDRAASERGEHAERTDRKRQTDERENPIMPTARLPSLSDRQGWSVGSLRRSYIYTEAEWWWKNNVLEEFTTLPIKFDGYAA